MKGPMNQHKNLAMGKPLAKANTKDLDSNGWGGSKKAGIHSGAGGTGSGGGKAVPKSTFTPD